MHRLIVQRVVNSADMGSHLQGVRKWAACGDMPRGSHCRFAVYAAARSVDFALALSAFVVSTRNRPFFLTLLTC